MRTLQRKGLNNQRSANSNNNQCSVNSNNSLNSKPSSFSRLQHQLIIRPCSRHNSNQRSKVCSARSSNLINRISLPLLRQAPLQIPLTSSRNRHNRYFLKNRPVVQSLRHSRLRAIPLSRCFKQIPKQLRACFRHNQTCSILNREAIKNFSFRFLRTKIKLNKCSHFSNK